MQTARSPTFASAFQPTRSSKFPTTNWNRTCEDWISKQGFEQVVVQFSATLHWEEVMKVVDMSQDKHQGRQAAGVEFSVRRREAGGVELKAVSQPMKRADHGCFKIGSVRSVLSGTLKHA